MEEYIVGYTQLIKDFEEIVNDRASYGYRKNLDENYITNSLIEQLEKKFQSIVLERDIDDILRVSWETYKAVGKTENLLGDILVIVHYRDEENEHDLLGVSTLEAKRRYYKGGKFDQLEVEQLERIESIISLSKVLLYDYEDISTFHCPLNTKTRMVTLPINICSTLKIQDTSLYNYSLPLSHQFIYRYFSGLDLVFNEHVISRVNKYINDSEEKGYGHYRYILKLRVTKNDFNTEDRIEDSISIPKDMYEHVLGRV